LGQPGLLQRSDLAGVADEPLDLEGRAEEGDEVGILLDDEHVVPCFLQVGRDVRAHIAGAGDGDLHQCVSSKWASRCSSSSVASLRTSRCSTSPSWPTRSGVTMRAWPPRVSTLSRNLPCSLMPPSLCPAHASGSERSTRLTSPLAWVHSAT